MKKFLLFTLLCFNLQAVADPLEVAITVDDLPVHIAKTNTDTFLAQMLLANKIPEPDNVKHLIASIPETKLDNLCRS